MPIEKEKKPGKTGVTSGFRIVSSYAGRSDTTGLLVWSYGSPSYLPRTEDLVNIRAIFKLLYKWQNMRLLGTLRTDQRCCVTNKGVLLWLKNRTK